MRRREIAPEAFLASVPLFKELDAPTLARLAEGVTRHALRRGEILFHKGDPATGLYVVVHGEIKLVSRTPVRGARLSGIVGPGQSFGEPVMFLERPMLVEAQACGDALVLQVPKTALFAEIERSPAFARRVIAGLSLRIERLVRELERQSGSSGRARFADYLLRRAGEGASTVTLPAPKAEIASQLNLTAEHFSRLLRELTEAGLLQVQGRRIALLDRARLEAVARRSRAAPD